MIIPKRSGWLIVLYFLLLIVGMILSAYSDSSLGDSQGQTTLEVFYPCGTIQNNTLLGCSTHMTERQVIRFLNEEELIKKRQLALNKLLDKIIQRESGGNPKICNLQFGCKAGMGLTGFVASTWNTTLDRMEVEEIEVPLKCDQKVKLPVSEDRSEAIFDAECSRFFASWLLMKDGIKHWEPYSGSYGTLADLF